MANTVKWSRNGAVGFIDWLGLFMAQNHKRTNQKINSLIVWLRSGQRILEHCTAETLLVS